MGDHKWPQVLGRTLRVLVSESVYETAEITINDGHMFIEFESDDLDSLMINLRDLPELRSGVELA